jgi:hypothetical protein
VLLHLDSLALKPGQRDQVCQLIVADRRLLAPRLMSDLSGCGLTEATGS